jgi:hypothetical protein
LAGRYYRLANAETERLSFEDYEGLQEWETKLNAYGNVLSTANVEQYLQREMAAAEDFLSFIAWRLATEAT